MVLQSVADIVRCILALSEKSINAPPVAPGKGSSGKNQNDALMKPWLAALPHTLRNHRGVLRIHAQCPSLIVQLLEALLKESVRSTAVGEACIRQFSFLVEAITLALSEDDATRFECFASLVVSAQVTLDYVEGSHRALGLAATMIFAGIAPPTALMPCIRRRIQELKRSSPDLWTAEVAAMVCLSLFDGLSRSSAATAEDTAAAAGGSNWVTLRKRETSQSLLSSWGPSPTNQSNQSYHPATNRVGPDASGSLSREGSPTTAGGGFVFVSKDHMSSNTVPFPDKLPPTVTASTSVVISCAILSNTTLTVQPALALGQWCFTALQKLPLTITACALTHLITKFPKAFRVSAIATDKSVRFCDAVVVQCSRIITTLFERRVLHGVHGPARRVAPDDRCHTEAGGAAHVPGGGEDMDDALFSVEVMPCFLLLCCEAIYCSRGLLMSVEAQSSLGKLFVYVCRLYVSHHQVVEEDRARAKVMHQMSETDANSCFRSHEAVEQVLRGTLRAVDAVLHDYDAGTPEALRRVLVAANRSGVLQRVSEFAGGQHDDLLDTITAAADFDLDEKIRQHSAEEASSIIAGSASKRDQGATVLFSLVGWLPSSCETPTLMAWNSLSQQTSGAATSVAAALTIGGAASRDDPAGAGGLAARQKMWVSKRMMEYFRREWYCSRLRTHALQAASPLSSFGLRETFFACSPVPI